MGGVATIEQMEAWWQERIKDRPFQVTTTTDVSPERVPFECGEHVSAVFTMGERTWRFATEQGRDIFIRTYSSYVTDGKGWHGH